MGISYKLINLCFGAVSLLTFPGTLLMPRMKIDDHVVEVSEIKNRRSRRLSDVFKDRLARRLAISTEDQVASKPTEIVSMNPCGDEKY
jgi:hypothetical protein